MQSHYLKALIPASNHPPASKQIQALLINIDGGYFGNNPQIHRKVPPHSTCLQACLQSCFLPHMTCLHIKSGASLQTPRFEDIFRGRPTGIRLSPPHHCIDSSLCESACRIYQLAFFTPGIRPADAISRNWIRLTPN